MKNKRILLGVSLLTVGLIAAAVPATVLTLKASNSGTPRTLTSEILPAKPGRGELVSFAPDGVSKFYQMDDLVNTYTDKAQEIGTLTPYNDELSSWTNHLSDSPEDVAYIRNLFQKYDAFRPTNNHISWKSSLDAKSYKIIISQDKDLSTIEREYVVDGSENSVLFENPYTATNYYWQVIATLQNDSKVYSDIFNFEVANLPRTINLPGVSNTRDLGGSIGFNNKRMKEGLVYRGMRLEAITDEAKDEFINELGIKTELDLRGVGEGTENVLNLPNYYHYPSPYQFVNGAQDTSGIDFFGSGSLVQNFGNAIKVMANKDNYPVYFHCSVGRDRTGWMGIALNLLCGVSEEATLKDFILSLFSVSGAYTKGNIDFYTRFNFIKNYLNDNYTGSNLSEKLEDYLVTKAGVTHEDCENVRKILLGDIDTGFKPGKVNEDPLTGLVKVTMRKFGESSVIKLVEPGTKLDDPHTVGNGAWYYGDKLWDFDVDTVQEDMYLDYISKDKCKVSVRYSGIELPDDALDVDYNTILDFSMFEKEGYTFKVYDDSYNQIDSLVVTDDVSINVVYRSTSGYIPKGNSRIIVMAGQSNGAGVGHYQYLSNALDEDKINEINNGYKNVLITGYSSMDLGGFAPVYADEHTRSAVTPGTFGFEVGLADRLSKAFPDETTYIVKYALGSISLNYEFISPSSEGIAEYAPPVIAGKERGWMYKGLVDTLTNAISEISETTNTTPMVEAFMWMQGESDAAFEGAKNVYLTSFNNLVKDFKEEFKDNLSYKFAVYDAGIYERSGIWLYGEEINNIKKSRVDEHNVYIDTEERLTTLFEPIGGLDNAHYDAACYIDLGHMFADAYLEKTVKGYVRNKLEIEGPEKVTMKVNENYVLDKPVAKLNGEIVDAKISYFAEQIKNAALATYSYFKVNDDNSFSPTRAGETLLRITAYYSDEVRTILVPVEITE